jgi:hypothetical protein
MPNNRVSGVPMPSDENLIQRVGNVRAMTGVTEPEFEALLPPFAQGFVAFMQDYTIRYD